MKPVFRLVSSDYLNKASISAELNTGDDHLLDAYSAAVIESAGLALIDAILGRGDLTDYHLAHAARADLCRRLGRRAEARSAYERALSLTQQEPERRFLERRLGELG